MLKYEVVIGYFMASKSDQTPGLTYMNAVLNSMRETLAEYEAGETEDLPINLHSLEVQKIMKPNVVVFWDDEKGEYYEEEDGEEVLDYYKFLITWGGPQAEVRTDDNGKNYDFFYCDWFGSDEFYHELSGVDLETVQAVFNIYFEVMV